MVAAFAGPGNRLEVELVNKTALLLLACLPLAAQTAPDAQPPRPASRPDPVEPTYVRRFSFGARLSILGLAQLKGGAVDIAIPVTPAQYLATGQSQSIRWAPGLGMQFALSERYTLNLDLLYRRIAYTRDVQVYEGVDSPNTIVDERKLTLRYEDTRGRIFDLPVMLRRYSKDRHARGRRFFWELGGNVRRASNISTLASVNGGCCDERPNLPGNKISLGAAGGAGMHLIDDFGIRVTPQVRYTYWLQRAIDTRPVRSNPHQVEFVLGVSF